MAWFRRPRQEEPPKPPPPADDSPELLRKRLDELTKFVNRNAGKLPGESVVTARLVTDMLGEVIDTSKVRPLDVYAVISVKGILEDYLPTTLRRYLALDPSQLDVPRPSGRVPSASLLEQIDSLLDGASAVLAAARAQDADALLAQGSFLRTKFTGSDLDL